MKTIQSMFLDSTISYLEDIKINYNKLASHSEIPSYSSAAIPPINRKLQLLSNLGFTNSIELKKQQDMIQDIDKKNKMNILKREKERDKLRELRTAFEIYLNARRAFGPETLFISFGDFFKVIMKKRLICGSFSDYKGDVPVDVLEKLNSLEIPKELSHYISPLWHISAADGIISRKLRKFPFIINGIRDIDGRYISRDYRPTTDGVSKLFICAPEKEMNVLHEHVVVQKVLPPPLDPLICAYTEYGIIIVCKWGEEADLPIIKKSEKLNALIDERAKYFNIKLFK